MKLHASGEDYLEAILLIERKKGAVRSIDIAEWLGVTKPSVSRAVSILKKGDFLCVKDNLLCLTDSGRAVAEKIYERHCYFKQRLMDVGVDEQTAEKEACQLEHSLSDDSFDKIRKASDQKHDQGNE